MAPWICGLLPTSSGVFRLIRSGWRLSGLLAVEGVLLWVFR